ncbi:hypothetical protein B4U79_01116, partial [Dinothrombium tinctorium]
QLTYRIVFAVSAGSERKGPIFLREPPHRIDFSNSTGAIVPCIASGTPNPQVTWYTRGGLPISEVAGLR